MEGHPDSPRKYKCFASSMEDSLQGYTIFLNERTSSASGPSKRRDYAPSGDEWRRGRGDQAARLFPKSSFLLEL